MLNESIEVLGGVGPKTVEKYHKLDIYTIYDLLTFFPNRYETDEIAEKLTDGKISLKVVPISEPYVAFYGFKKSKLVFTAKYGEQTLKVVFYNQAYLKKRIIPGKPIIVTGKYEGLKEQLTGSKLTDHRLSTSSGLMPVYPLTKGVRQKQLTDLIKQSIEKYLDEVNPYLINEQFIKDNQLIDLQQAIKQVHSPKDFSEIDEAKKTLAYVELFVFFAQLELIRRDNNLEQKVEVIDYDRNVVRDFLHNLPFKLTEDQDKTIKQILNDFEQGIWNSRLIQGDVGSGKTIVAITIILAIITGGYQAALMVPTEILAKQHFETLKKLLAEFNINIGLLLGNTSTKDKKLLKEDIKSGKINLVIGTQALIQNDVSFKKLGLVIIDEQHRFGVEQRRNLRIKGADPYVISMTATPIPRTVALMLYNQLQISQIKTMPQGRKPIYTKLVGKRQNRELMGFMEQTLKKGQQIYCVVPLIEETGKSDGQNANELYTNLSKYFNGRYNVGLLHGKMKEVDKQNVFKEFKNGKINLLVSTTVIEVGVDVPNATTMVIFNAERFGLAQLHQLRGRIGRNDIQSYCFLVSDVTSQSSLERLNLMVKSHDGFELANEDFRLRGPGDIFERVQSGLPEFKIADIQNDEQLIFKVKENIQNLFIKDPNLNRKENLALKNYLRQSLGRGTVKD